MSSCKPESQKQRLERIAVQLMAGMMANPSLTAGPEMALKFPSAAVGAAKALIKQLDALPLDE